MLLATCHYFLISDKDLDKICLKLPKLTAQPL